MDLAPLRENSAQVPPWPVGWDWGTGLWVRTAMILGLGFVQRAAGSRGRGGSGEAGKGLWGRLGLSIGKKDSRVLAFFLGDGASSIRFQGRDLGFPGTTRCLSDG